VAGIAFATPTRYSLSVDVRDVEGSLTPAGPAPRQSTAVVQEVPEQGEAWVFLFGAQDKRSR
jgi:hypothetical protein